MLMKSWNLFFHINRIFPISSLSFSVLPYFVIIAVNYTSVSIDFLKTYCFKIRYFPLKKNAPFFYGNVWIRLCVHSTNILISKCSNSYVLIVCIFIFRIKNNIRLSIRPFVLFIYRFRQSMGNPVNSSWEWSLCTYQYVR